MFILGILIIIALFVFRASYKVQPEDRRIEDKLKVRRFATVGGIVVGGFLILASLLRIVPPGSTEYRKSLC